jgi:hypothetical protein
MYFGNQDENNTNDSDVWDVNAALVQHFNNNVLDSTIYANNGTANGSPEYIDGISSKAMYFDGINDYVNLGTKPINSPLQMREGIITVSHWIKPQAWNSLISIFHGAAGGSYKGYGTGLSSVYPRYRFEIYGESGGRQGSNPNIGINQNWNQLLRFLMEQITKLLPIIMEF